MYLFLPTLIDSIRNNIKISAFDVPNKEDLNAVLDRGQLGVVHPMFPVEPFPSFSYLSLNRGKAKFRLTGEKSWLLPLFVDDPMLHGFDAFHLTCFAVIRKNRSITLAL